MRQRIARKRILTTAVVLFVAAGAALMASVRPQWRQDVSPPPINLGTARLQAEVMAELIDLRPTPPGKPPASPIPMKAVSSAMLTRQQWVRDRGGATGRCRASTLRAARPGARHAIRCDGMDCACLR